MEAPVVELPKPLQSQVPVRLVPAHNWRAHWLTTAEFARLMGRSQWTVQTWLRNGTLADFGIPVCRFRGGKLHSGRTFIQNIY